MAIATVTVILIGLFVAVDRGEGGYTANPTLHLFSADTAPEDGSVVLYVQFGELNRPEGSMIGGWRVAKGAHLDQTVQVPANQKARAWYQPDSSDVWYLLPSQFWQADSVENVGGGTCESEYGISADADIPSYHTYFANAIAQQDVPIVRDSTGSRDRCGQGSSIWRDGPPATATLVPSPGATSTPAPPSPTATPIATATPCISLESEQYARYCR